MAKKNQSNYQKRQNRNRRLQRWAQIMAIVMIGIMVIFALVSTMPMWG